MSQEEPVLPRTPPATGEMRAQVDALLVEHSVTATWTDASAEWLDAHGDLQTRKIVAPRILDELAYFVALHEIGHIVLTIPTEVEVDGLTRTSLDNEVAVWAWVRGKALIDPSDEAKTSIFASVMSHVPDAHRQDAALATKRLRWVLGV